MWHIEVAACHIEERCMKETFIQFSKGVYVAAPGSDKYRQQVRLAVLVARIRGAVRSGVCACLRALRDKECLRPSCTLQFSPRHNFVESCLCT